MPINFTGSTRNFSELEQITEELYQDSKTLRERVIILKKDTNQELMFTKVK